MKKVLWALALCSIIVPMSSFAYTEHNIQSANYLATQGVIVDNSGNIKAYNLDSNITRREMLKVMMNLSGKTVTDTCNGDFSDLSSSDWGCKYAQAALDEWYIAANATFRPDDNVTQIEALKMIMQALGIERDSNDDWRAGYVSKAQSEGIITESYIDYNKNATRGWIFSAAARSDENFSYVESELEINPEVEELFQYILNL